MKNLKRKIHQYSSRPDLPVDYDVYRRIDKEIWDEVLREVWHTSPWHIEDYIQDLIE